MKANVRVSEKASNKQDQLEFNDMFGQKLREARKARGYSIAETGRRAGLSVGLISQIERGLSSPSISSLRQLCAALGTPVGQFFSTPEPTDVRNDDIVTRPGQRRMLVLHQDGIHTELLTPSSSGALQMFIANIQPGGSSGPDLDVHEGEEAGLVLSGRLKLWVGDESYLLDEGCSFRFSSHMPHRYENPGPIVARVQWVITPPIY